MLEFDKSAPGLAESAVDKQEKAAFFQGIDLVKSQLLIALQGFSNDERLLLKEFGSLLKLIALAVRNKAISPLEPIIGRELSNFVALHKIKPNNAANNFFIAILKEETALLGSNSYLLSDLYTSLAITQELKIQFSKTLCAKANYHNLYIVYCNEIYNTYKISLALNTYFGNKTGLSLLILNNLTKGIHNIEELADFTLITKPAALQINKTVMEAKVSLLEKEMQSLGLSKTVDQGKEWHGLEQMQQFSHILYNRSSSPSNMSASPSSSASSSPLSFYGDELQDVDLSATNDITACRVSGKKMHSP